MSRRFVACPSGDEHAGELVDGLAVAIGEKIELGLASSTSTARWWPT